jgi:cytochrome c5
MEVVMMKQGTTALAFVLSAWMVIGAAHAQGERTGEQIVKQQCSHCHEAGVSGAPRIGDRAAWAPRMKRGVDATVRSAIGGHGKMPARGGLADLTDSELRAAILYMFNPATASATKPAVVARAPRDFNMKVVNGIEVYLGMVPADAVRDEKLHEGAPSGKGYYHVNISLHDAETKAEIKDAQVEARVANPVTGGATKKLLPMTTNNAVSYGNYFRMTGAEPYTITVRVRLPKEPGTTVARFDVRR